MICNEFSYTTIDRFFDGDVELLKKVNVIMYSFVRKVETNSFSVDKIRTENVLKLIDSIKLPKTSDEEDAEDNRQLHGMLFPLSEQEKKDLDLRTKLIKQDLPADEVMVNDDDVRFFEYRKAVPSTEKFRNRFIDDYRALNPLEVENKVKMNARIKSSIERKCDKEKKERREELSTESLMYYFQVSPKDLDDFENDLFLPISDNSYFEIQKQLKLKQEKAMLELKDKYPTNL